ncbi:MAG: SDR family oxidoreductase [Candidatus Kapaibacterium sp.]|nr:MAG: SDR family oxidoreductase [Candidatus Kapabacteria bacterium]
MNNTSSLNLAESTLWITGASRGIGAACAKVLARTGAHLLLSARSQDALTNTIASLHSEARYTIVPCDVTSNTSVQAAYKEIAFQHGAVDILVNNAGIGIFAPFAELSLDDAEAMLRTNLHGAIACTQAVLPAMRGRTSGVIVNINSVAAVKTFAGASVYAASKAGLLAMSRVLREEVRKDGIKVIDLLVGATATDIWSVESRTEFEPRMMQPDDIAEALLAALRLPPRIMPEELVLRPQHGDL